MKKAFKIIKYALLGIIIAVCVFIGVVCIIAAVQKSRGTGIPVVFGFGAATVETGSMEPVLYAGDLIIIKAVDEYAEGDIITFYDTFSGVYVTHRIISYSEGLYITKGDANNAQDSGGVAQENIVGKVVLVLSGAGDFAEFLQSPAGILCIIGAIAIIWGATELVTYIITKKNEKDKDNKDNVDGKK